MLPPRHSVSRPVYCFASCSRCRRRHVRPPVIRGRFHPLLFLRRQGNPFLHRRCHRLNRNPFHRLLFGDAGSFASIIPFDKLAAFRVDTKPQPLALALLSAQR